ncbi:NAD(P)-dependent dehydrogenase (short-subunit alcohol dehydrogenase family) [Amycolatopsis lexingtonensis]|uniref:NAD(P)-dependent dehydrogenase (Short-subunit alcohol dehydrogenase family) n=1 Tax=Amycolatopsis lexingtonensis TaxID=218822 RepID=A0ABR9HUD4_9PSEU|nr:SDR family NAD(P)-dependent oxidoreductase [Amycolatopsis lexingtonensis]MBE1494537.1 NAD(P)-dependent dehydrogenase (short-subunit alcohol dehydrogenase family) [Amycolatopsis lexingtonensis]
MTSYVVTGASSGIGRACVAELVRRGAHVWASVRTDADEAELVRAYGDAVTVLRMDLRDPASIAACGERVTAGGPVRGLVNNAGLARPGPLEYVPLEAFREQLDVNVTGQLAVTRAMLPALRIAETARVVTVGSIGGRIAGPMVGPYHTSKFALVGLTDSLRAELAPEGIEVVLVEPGAVATSIWPRARAAAEEVRATLPAAGLERYSAQLAAAERSAARSARTGVPPRRAAEVVVRALTARRPAPRYLVGTDARVAAVLANLPFRLRYRLTAAKR